MTTDLSAIELSTLLVSLSAIGISIVTFIQTGKEAMIQSFISLTTGFFTLETREMRRDLRDNKVLTDLKGYQNLEGLRESKKELCELSEKDKKKVWEMVSAYNRLGFVLHNHPRIFVFLSLKNKFLEWDAETVIDMWERVRLYVYQARNNPGRKDFGKEFELLYNEAIEYKERKNKRKRPRGGGGVNMST